MRVQKVGKVKTPHDAELDLIDICSYFSGKSVFHVYKKAFFFCKSIFFFYFWSDYKSFINFVMQDRNITEKIITKKRDYLDMQMLKYAVTNNVQNLFLQTIRDFRRQELALARNTYI